MKIFILNIIAIFFLTSLSFSPERDKKITDARISKFKEFLNHFPNASLPFTLNKEKLAYYGKNYKKVLTKDKLIDTKYQEFFEEPLKVANLFSRSPNYKSTYYVAKLKENTAYNVVLYAVCASSDPNQLDRDAHIYFFIASYDSNGERIDNKHLTGFELIDKEINTDRNIYIDQNLNINNYANLNQSDPYDCLYKISENGTFNKYLPTPIWYQKIMNFFNS